MYHIRFTFDAEICGEYQHENNKYILQSSIGLKNGVEYYLHTGILALNSIGSIGDSH